MKKLILVLMLLLVAGECFAQITDRNYFFTSLCLGEQSIGFHWANEKWNRTNFSTTTDKYIIKKINPEKDYLIAILCRIELKDYKKDGNGEYFSLKGCYAKKEMGSEKEFLGEICEEFWKVENNTNYLLSITCKSPFNGNFKFHPNGEYFSHRYPNLLTEDVRDNRSAFSITVGKCSII